MFDSENHHDIYDDLENRRYTLADVDHLTDYIMDTCIPESFIDAVDDIEISDIAYDYPPLMKERGKIFHSPWDKCKVIIHAALMWNFQRTTKNQRLNTLMHICEPFPHHPEIRLRMDDLLRWQPVRAVRQVKKITTPDPDEIEYTIATLEATAAALAAEVRELEAVPAVRKYRETVRQLEKVRKQKTAERARLKSAVRQRSFN